MSAQDTRDDGAAGASGVLLNVALHRTFHKAIADPVFKIGPEEIADKKLLGDALNELLASRAEVAALRPVVEAVERYGRAWARFNSVGGVVLDEWNAAEAEMQAVGLALALARAAHDDAPDKGGGE